MFKNDVTELWENMFANKKLTNITLPKSLLYIETAAIQLTELTEIILPDSAKRNLGYAFSDNHKLVSIIFPENYEFIGQNSFTGCESLLAIYCKSSIPPELVSLNCPTKTNIYIPTESVEQYKTADVWSQYASQIVGYDFTE